MKKLLLALALISASQIQPWYGRGGGYYGGGYWGGPYGGYGYGYSPAADAIGTAALIGTTAAIASSRPRSDAEIDYMREKDAAREEKRDREQQRKDINKQIKDIDKDIRSARRDGDNESARMLEKQKADLRKELARV